MPVEERVFLDTNVVLDYLCDRVPFAEFAHALFGLSEKKEIALYVSALSFSNVFYILRKSNGHAAAIEALRKLRQLVIVATVGGAEIENAFQLCWRDFEDAIQYASAEAIGKIELIISRNPADFPKGKIPVVTPEEYFLARAIRRSPNR